MEEDNKINSCKDLIVWQKAMELVVLIYSLSETFPKTELYCLTPQMRRCAISIPSNIAEGCRRRTRKDYRQFLVIAFGSGAELETQIEIAKRLSYSKAINYTEIDKLLDEIMRMLNKLISRLGSSE
ncbi:MAG: four helix bundle protein [Candidatus Berkelbacteria bacterium]